MEFHEPRVEFVPIDLSELVTSGYNSQCGGSESEPGGGEACENSYYTTSQCSYDPTPCPQFC